MTESKQRYDAPTVAVMRQALNEVVADRRFSARKTLTTLEVAEHILQQAASGERDLDRLKSSALDKLSDSTFELSDEKSASLPEITNPFKIE
jgi:hypothetical protein